MKRPCDESYDPLDEQTRHQSIASSSLYFADKKRSDLSVAASMSCLNISQPRCVHIITPKRALLYLNATTDQYVAISLGNNNQSTSHVSASWDARSQGERKSRIGCVIRFGEAIIYAARSVQRSIALISKTGKFLALENDTKTVQWLRAVLAELEDLQKSTKIYQDNKSPINSENGNPAKFYSRRIHIDVKYHYINDLIDKGSITIKPTPAWSVQAALLTMLHHPYAFRLAVRSIDLLAADNQLPERC